jgi:hypothetical protein
MSRTILPILTPFEVTLFYKLMRFLDPKNDLIKVGKAVSYRQVL